MMGKDDSCLGSQSASLSSLEHHSPSLRAISIRGMQTTALLSSRVPLQNSIPAWMCDPLDLLGVFLQVN